MRDLFLRLRDILYYESTTNLVFWWKLLFIYHLILYFGRILLFSFVFLTKVILIRLLIPVCLSWIPWNEKNKSNEIPNSIVINKTILSHYTRTLNRYTNTYTFDRQPESDLDLNAITGGKLLDCAAAKHKLSVKPRKTHTSCNSHRSISPQSAMPSDAKTPRVRFNSEENNGDGEKYVFKFWLHSFYFSSTCVTIRAFIYVLHKNTWWSSIDVRLVVFLIKILQLDKVSG